MKKIIILSLVLTGCLLSAFGQAAEFNGIYWVQSWTLNRNTDMTNEVESSLIAGQSNTVMIFVYTSGRPNPNNPNNGVRHTIIMSNYNSATRTYRDVEYVGQGIIDQLTGRLSRSGNRVTVEVFFDGQEFDRLVLVPWN